MNLVFDPAWLPRLSQGVGLTMQLTIYCMGLGATLGMLLGLVRVYGGGRWSPLYWLASTYVHFFRGTPLLVQLITIYLGLPTIGIRLSPFVAGLIAMTLNTAAYQAEYFRGAIQSVKAGQMLAARAIGMSRGQAIRQVILPQALRLIIPPWSNELIYMLKYSSIVSMTALRPETMDLFGVGRSLVSRNFRYFEVYILVALFYLAMVLILTVALRWVERRVRVPGLGTPGRGI